MAKIVEAPLADSLESEGLPVTGYPLRFKRS